MNRLNGEWGSVCLKGARSAGSRKSKAVVREANNEMPPQSEIETLYVALSIIKAPASFSGPLFAALVQKAVPPLRAAFSTFFKLLRVHL